MAFSEEQLEPPQQRSSGTDSWQAHLAGELPIAVVEGPREGISYQRSQQAVNGSQSCQHGCRPGHVWQHVGWDVGQADAGDAKGDCAQDWNICSHAPAQALLPRLAWLWQGDNARSDSCTV